MRSKIWQIALVGLSLSVPAVSGWAAETREQAAERERLEREQDERTQAVRAQLPPPPGVSGEKNESDKPGAPQAPLDPRGPIKPAYRPSADHTKPSTVQPAARPRRIPPGSDDPSQPPGPPSPRIRPISPSPTGAVPPPRRVEASDVFQRLDTDGDGVLTLEEFRHVFDRPGAVPGAGAKGDSIAEHPKRRPDAAVEGTGEEPASPPRERTASQPPKRTLPADAPPAAWKDEPEEAADPVKQPPTDPKAQE